MHHLRERTRQALRASWEEALVLAGKYALWARLAGEAGLAPVQEEFRACARQTLTHAEVWLRCLAEGKAPVASDALEQALRAERALWSDALRARARAARGEGHADIADLLERAGEVSGAREERLQALYDEVRAGEVYDRRERAMWVCAHCGWAHLSARAPEVCPLCGHGRDGFRRAPQ